MWSPWFSRDSLTLNLLSHQHLLVEDLLESWIELSCSSGTNRVLLIRRWALRIILLLPSLTSSLATSLLVSTTSTSMVTWWNVPRAPVSILWIFFTLFLWTGYCGDTRVWLVGDIFTGAMDNIPPFLLLYILHFLLPLFLSVGDILLKVHYLLSQVCQLLFEVVFALLILIQFLI